VLKVKVKVKLVKLFMERHLTATECHLPYGITQCYLPPDTSEHTPPSPQPVRSVLSVSRQQHSGSLNTWKLRAGMSESTVDSDFYKTFPFWLRKWSHITILVYSSCSSSCWGDALDKTPKAPSFEIGSKW